MTGTAAMWLSGFAGGLGALLLGLWANAQRRKRGEGNRQSDGLMAPPD